MALTFTVLLLHSIGFNKNAWNREGSRIPRKCNFWEIWSKNRLAPSPIPYPRLWDWHPFWKILDPPLGTYTETCIFMFTLCSVQLTVLENSVFSSTLAWSPMASRSYQFESDFLNYLPRLASDILAEQKSRKNFYSIFKNCFPQQSSHFSLSKANLTIIMTS